MIQKNIVTRMLSWIGSRELAVLIAVFGILLLIMGFVELSEEVFDGETHEFDRVILLSMRDAANPSDPLGPGWFEEIGRDVTALGGNILLVLITAAVIGYLILDGKKKLAFVLMFATLGALTVSSILKSSFDRPRPDVVPHNAEVYTASFPSGHSMLAASTYLTMGALLARAHRRRIIKAYILLVCVAVTLLVGISRIYLGVHWPTDVLAGWTAGAGWALVCWLLASWLQSRGEVEQP